MKNLKIKKINKIVKSVANGLFKMFKHIHKHTGIHEFTTDNSIEIDEDGRLSMILTIEIPIGETYIGVGKNEDD